MSDCLIVLGMHRSGTSALAGAVHRLGAAVGSDVAEAPDGNVRGYYEQSCVFDLHEDLLEAYGSSWDDIAPPAWLAKAGETAVEDFQLRLKDLLREEFADAPLWVVKDPRLCLLLPLWLPVLAQLEVTPYALCAYRPAAEVADSLARRNRFSVDKSNLLWFDHVVAAERASRGLRRCFIAFDELLGHPVQTLERASSQLGIDWPRSPADRAKSLDRFIDPGLRHSTVASSSPPVDVIVALEAALAKAAASPLDRASFDVVAGRRRELGSPDALVVEHLQQFARREVAADVWTAKETLRAELTAIADRLGKGLAAVEDALAELVTEQSELATGLGEQARLATDRSLGVDRTLDHLAELAARLESATRHQDTQLNDLRSRLDRLQDEVEVEAQLGSLRTDLDYVGNRVAELTDLVQAQNERMQELTGRVQEVIRSKTWWQRLRDRLWPRRSPLVQPDGSIDL